MFYTDDLSSPRTKVCSSCGRPMSRSVKGDICQACSDEELYAEVKDYILHNNVTEMEVAETFGIPLKQVRAWIKDGRIDYRNNWY